MPRLTGQKASFDGMKQQLDAFADMILSDRGDYLRTAKTSDKETIILSGDDPVMTYAYWFRENVISPLLSDVPKGLDVKNPANGNGK